MYGFSLVNFVLAKKISLSTDIFKCEISISYSLEYGGKYFSPLAMSSNTIFY